MQLINLANFDEFFLNILIVTVVCKAPSVNKGKKNVEVRVYVPF